ncbi:MAG: 4'-phosphopantetheinyl transferase superfamily protein [Deltaproteobacteria bacterium]|nr:4'-phosphopantetheinyl transferase superfamily protein [Deltaproteobacteria bacterium]
MASKPEKTILQLAHGLCVVIRWPGGDPDGSGLHPGERAFAATLAPRRARIWIAGRIALREALARLRLSCEVAILSTERGAPLLPAGMAGSVSHKAVGDEIIAAALVASGSAFTLGIDIEVTEALGVDVGKKVLTAAESAEIERVAPDRRRFETLLRFSIKEAVFKAVDPILRAKISFQVATVLPSNDGTVDIEWRLPPGVTRPETEAMWKLWNGLILTTARSAKTRSP